MNGEYIFNCDFYVIKIMKFSSVLDYMSFTLINKTCVKLKYEMPIILYDAYVMEQISDNHCEIQHDDYVRYLEKFKNYKRMHVHCFDDNMLIPAVEMLNISHIEFNLTLESVKLIENYGKPLSIKHVSMQIDSDIEYNTLEYFSNVKYLNLHGTQSCLSHVKCTTVTHVVHDYIDYNPFLSNFNLDNYPKLKKFCELIKNGTCEHKEITHLNEYSVSGNYIFIKFTSGPKSLMVQSREILFNEALHKTTNIKLLCNNEINHTVNTPDLLNLQMSSNSNITFIAPALETLTIYFDDEFNIHKLLKFIQQYNPRKCYVSCTYKPDIPCKIQNTAVIYTCL